MPRDINAIKSELAKLARQKNNRIVSFWPEEPSKWWPGSVIDPRSGKVFTNAGAWDFVAEHLERKETKIEKVPLWFPRGKDGYAFTVKDGKQTIYIKVSLGKDVIIARSFHLSEGD